MCISSTYSFLLVNCSPWFFKTSQRLRQADPSSPFLFTIVVEALSALNELGLITGFWHSRREAITHFQLADDTVLLSSTR